MAKRKRKRNDIAATAIGFIGAGVGMGVGAGVLGGIPGAAAASAATGVGKMASFMPTMGTVAGAGMTLKQLKRLGKRY